MQFSCSRSGKNTEYQWVWTLGLNIHRKYLLYHHSEIHHYRIKFSLLSFLRLSLNIRPKFHKELFSLCSDGAANHRPAAEKGLCMEDERRHTNGTGLRAFRNAAIPGILNQSWAYLCSGGLAKCFSFKDFYFQKGTWYTEAPLHLSLDQVCLLCSDSIHIQTQGYSWSEHTMSEPFYKIEMPSWSRWLARTFFYLGDSTC